MTIEKKNLDLNYHPGDDFYNYANGGWLKNNPLPDEFSRYGTFDKLAEDNQKILKELIENASKNPGAEGSIPQKVGDFFKSGMDSDKIESFGFQPIIHDLKQIENTESKDQLLSILYGFHTQSNPVLFHLFGSPDKKDSSMVIANLYQGGLGLTDVDYYISGDEKSKEIRKKYLEYIEDMLKLTGEESAGEKAKIILAFEKRLALHSMSRLERRDPHKTYHKMSLEELSGLCPQINWKKYFKECGLKISEINVSQPEFFKEIGEMLNDLQLNVWQLYSKWHVINNASPYLSSEFLNRNFEFYGKFLSGRKSLQPNWKRVLIAEDYALGEAIGQMFVEKYFPPAAKQRMLILVANLKAALELRIQKLDWMTSSTKKEALEKLKTMGVKIGYPDKWRDYSKLRISSENYFGNLKNARIHNFQYQMDKIGKEVDPEEWGMTPQTVNAYYHPLRNEIVFPAGILQPPFFHPEADDAVNYGAIGVVIGHEMTHGFDDQGRQFDKNGNLSDWWTDSDSEKFKERTKVLIKQFSAYKISDTVKADGKLTLGENIADLGGLNISLTALKLAWKKNPPEKNMDGFTPEQRFFLAYAHVWAGNITGEEMLRRTKEDVHSLGHLRVNGPLPNMEEFYRAFPISETSALYIPEEERASIW